MITSRQRILAAALLASAAFAASAQTPPPVPSAPNGPAPVATQQQQRQHAAPDGKSFERMQERRARHLDELKSQLKLDGSQQAAWSNFVAATQPPARGPRPDRAEMEQLTTPQRLDRMQARQAEHAAMFARRNEATRALYAVLKPEQQKVFDAQTLRRAGHASHEGQGGPGQRRMHDAPTKG